MNKLKTSLLLFSFTMIGCGESPRVMWNNFEAVRLIHRGDSVRSQEKLFQAIVESPFRSELHNNLGFSVLAEEMQKQKKLIEMQQAQKQAGNEPQPVAPAQVELPVELINKASQSFKQSEKWAKSDSQKLIALFNQAVMLQLQKKYEESLAKYQSALAIDPTSTEIKQNIELMQLQIQQQQQEQDKKNQEQDQQNGQSQDNQDQKDSKDKKEKKDKKDNQDQKDQQNQEQQDSKDKQDGKESQPKKYQNQGKPQPKPFESKELSEGDAKKILGELKQQEQKIRAEYNRHESKEQPRDKDW